MKCRQMTIGDLRDTYKNGQINLAPPYQRKPVWKTKQRLLLLSSLFNGIPIPALIFHKQFHTGTLKEIYDVLDGKQRIETILHFIELKKIRDEGRLWVEFINPHTNKRDYLFYHQLDNKKVNKEYENILEKFWTYKLPIIEYEGDLSDFFGNNVASKEVFVRVNSTGSPLKKHEIRHAKCAGLFFKLGDMLEEKYMNLFVNQWRVCSSTDTKRYLLHEFILELCVAIHLNIYSDRRKKLDELLSQYKWTGREIVFVRKGFNKIIRCVKDIFPNDSIKYTRFKNKSDFYSLFVVLLQLLNKGYVLDSRKDNRIIGKFLSEFSKQIQRLDPKVKKFVIPNLPESEQKLLPYIISTRQATDSLRNRETRHKYLMSVLKEGFILKTKDNTRIFDSSVKDLLWLLQKQNKPRCPNPTCNEKCKKYLTYDDAQVDHKYPWSKGGRTTLENARLICSSCNSSKGNRQLV